MALAIATSCLPTCFLTAPAVLELRPSSAAERAEMERAGPGQRRQRTVLETRMGQWDSPLRMLAKRSCLGSARVLSQLWHRALHLRVCNMQENRSASLLFALPRTRPRMPVGASTAKSDPPGSQGCLAMSNRKCHEGHEVSGNGRCSALTSVTCP